MTKNWYLIQTKPRQENIVQSHMQNQGFEVYLPTFTLDSKNKPLFPGYIFANLADDIDWTPVFSTKGVARFVRFGSEFAIVPEPVIKSIMSNEQATSDKLLELSTLQKGDQLTVTSGPLKDFVVTFEKYTSDERIVVLFKMLQQEQALTVNKDQVLDNIENRHLIRPIADF